MNVAVRSLTADLPRRRFSATDLPKSDLLRLLVRAAGADLVVGVENTLQLADEVLVEPDLAVFPRAAVLPDSPFIKLRGEDVLLVIEIALTSLAYDRGAKAAVYARHGIREYWVVDPEHHRAWVHTGPSEEGWGTVEERGREAVLAPKAPELASFHVALAQIG